MQEIPYPILAVDIGQETALGLLCLPDVPAAEWPVLSMPAPDWPQWTRVSGESPVPAGGKTLLDGGRVADFFPDFGPGCGPDCGPRFGPGSQPESWPESWPKSWQDSWKVSWKDACASAGLPAPATTLLVVRERECLRECLVDGVDPGLSARAGTDRAGTDRAPAQAGIAQSDTKPNGKADGKANIKDGLIPFLERQQSRTGRSGLPLRVLAEACADPMLRLSAIHRITGLPVFESGATFIFGLLASAGLEERSFSQGLTLLRVSDEELQAALVFQDHLAAFMDLPFNPRFPGPDHFQPELLQPVLEDFRLGWLPEETLAALGGQGWRAPAVPPEAEGYNPTYVVGPAAAILRDQACQPRDRGGPDRNGVPERTGNSAGTEPSTTDVNNCHGALRAYCRAWLPPAAARPYQPNG